MINKILIFFIVLIAFESEAQVFGDAVRYSYLNPSGTARTLGVGGSFGAMGGDFSVVNINPAGIGQYYSGEFTISPSINGFNTSSYLNKSETTLTTKRSGSAFTLDNLGLVFSSSPIGSSWKNSNFLIGFSKLADLNRTFEYSGTSYGSITQRFAEKANGKLPEELDDFEAGPAFDTGAIFDQGNDQNYETDFDDDPLVPKNQLVNQKGYISEVSFGWGGNYDNKLNVGVSIGVPLVSFEESKTYQETDNNNSIPIFNTLDYSEYLNTSGAGINIKAGFVYKLADYLRIGGAVHTPTWYTLTDDYNGTLTYSYTDTSSHVYEKSTPDGSFKYKLKTPMKVIGSIGSIYKLGNIQGFANADVEWLDYGTNEFDFTKYSSNPSEQSYTTEVNNDVDRYLGQVMNIRLGTELAYQKIRVRAGYEIGQSPYNADSDKITNTSFGIGFREDKFFLDFGVRLNNFSEGYQSYTLVDSEKDPTVTIQTEKRRYVMTAGFKF